MPHIFLTDCRWPHELAERHEVVPLAEVERIPIPTIATRSSSLIMLLSRNRSFMEKLHLPGTQTLHIIDEE